MTQQLAEYPTRQQRDNSSSFASSTTKPTSCHVVDANRAQDRFATALLRIYGNADPCSSSGPPADEHAGLILAALQHDLNLQASVREEALATETPSVSKYRLGASDQKSSTVSQSNPSTNSQQTRMRTSRRRATSDRTGADRRLYPRHDSGCVVSVYRRADTLPLNQQQVEWALHSSRLKGALVDISMNGASFELSEPFDKGENILVRIANRLLDQSVDTSATVVRSLENSDGQWKTVCRFVPNLSYDQVSALGHYQFMSQRV